MSALCAYYISGPFSDGSYGVCELATGRVIRTFRSEEDLLGPQQYREVSVTKEGFGVKRFAVPSPLRSESSIEYYPQHLNWDDEDDG